MAKHADGFTLYHMDDGTNSQLSGLSDMSPYSGPSQGSSNLRVNYGGRAPPPQSATLRTNFTTGAAAGGGPLPQSPRNGNFHTMNTPPGAAAPGAHVTMVGGPAAQRQGAGVTSTFSIWAILGCILVGCVLGGVIHQFDWDPAVSKWVKLPGDLYVRAIQCLVVPLVFVNLAVSVADIIHLGQGQRIGLRVAMLFVFTTALCVAEGIGMGYVSRALLQLTNTALPVDTNAVFGIQCSNGKYLEELANGLVTCTATSMKNATSQFLVDDVNDAFVRNAAILSTGGTLTDNLLVVLRTMVPSNIMAALVGNTLLSIVAFAIPCGIALAKSFHGPIQLNPLLEFLREVNESLMMMVNWVLRFTPFAVLSLLAGSFGASLKEIMTKSPIALTLNVTGLFAAAIALHMLVVLPILFGALAHSNPLSFMGKLFPAYVYSVGCSSSVATLPVALRCIEQSRAAANSTMYFVMSIGASLNMHGTAIYLPMMVMLLVDISGLNSHLGDVQMGVLALASFLGAFAAAPIPGGSVIMLTTVWSITFPSVPLPSYYAFILAADVVLDRLVTLCNVNGDAMISRMVEEQVGAMRANPSALRA